MELVSIDETCHHIFIQSMCIEDLQSTNLCQQIWDHLLQKSYTNSSLILEGKFFQIKAFYIFCISSINCFENEATNVRCTILDSANILKINIFPSSAIFPILHNFKTFCIFDAFRIFICIYNFWLWEKCLPKIVIVSDV